MSEPSVEVQGIVARRDEGTVPLVQFRAIEAGAEVYGWQQPPDAARNHARLVLESAANAVYESAFMNFMLSEGADEEVAARMLLAFREHRQDTWGQRAPERWWVT